MAERMGKRMKSIETVMDTEVNSSLNKELYLDVSKLNIVSVEDVESGNYENRMNKDEVVGGWPGDESIEELLNILTK